MRDFFATLGIFTGLLFVIALVMYGLSRWHARVEKRLRPLRAEFEKIKIETAKRIRRASRGYPTISRADLDVEAANAEIRAFPLSEHIRHRNKFEGRHYDAESVG